MINPVESQANLCANVYFLNFCVIYKCALQHKFEVKLYQTEAKNNLILIFWYLLLSLAQTTLKPEMTSEVIESFLLKNNQNILTGQDGLRPLLRTLQDS
jgi:hypothetical protein